MDGVGLPAVAPERTGAEHHVELTRLLRLGFGVVEAVPEARALERPLRVALDLLGQLDAEALVHGGHDVDAVCVLVAQLALGLDACRPVHHHRVAYAALPGVALEELEGRVEGHRPAGGVVVVGRHRAELVDEREVLLHVVGHGVEEVVLVDRAVRAALARGAVVGDPDDERVVELAGLLEVVDQASGLVIGVGAVAGVDLGHAGEEPLLVCGERVPRTHQVTGRERLAVDALHVRHRVHR